MVRARKLPHLLIGALIVFAVLLAATLPARAADTGMTIAGVDVSSAPEVTLTLGIDGSAAAESLDEGDFTLLVSGEQREVALTGVPSDPMQVELVIDTSGSMKGAPLEAAKAAALTLVQRLPESTRIGVVGFGSAPYEASVTTTDRAQTRAAISGLQPSGETALYDAVIAGTSRLQLDRRALVLLTDGRDTASTALLEHAVPALSASRASFYSVVLETPEVDAAAVGSLATAAGGTVVSAADPAALAGVYEAIAGQLAATYQLSFRATATGSTGMIVQARVDGTTLEAETRVSIPRADVPAPVVDDAAPAIAAEVAAEPGPLQQGWVMWMGIAALFVAILLMTLIVVTRSAGPNQLATRLKHRAPRPGTVQNLAASATSFAERSLDRSGRRGRLEVALERAGINIRAGEFLVLVGTGAFAVFALALLLWNALVGLVVAAGAVIGTRALLGLLADRRRAKFAEQLDTTLPLMAGSLRAGFGLMQALDAVARESEAPTSEEFRRLVVETRLGRDLDDGLRAMGARVGNEDFRWAAQAIEIHRQIGGDLAEVLDNVHATLRDRNQLRRRIQALSGEGKLSAVILFILPIAMLLFIAAANPKYLAELTSRGLGLAMLLVAGGLMVAGGLWMRRIIRLVF
jgi:tight adherence protein B